MSYRARNDDRPLEPHTLVETAYLPYPKGRYAVLAIVPTDSPVRGASRPGLALIRRVHLERPDNCRRAAAAGLSLAQ